MNQEERNEEFNKILENTPELRKMHDEWFDALMAEDWEREKWLSERIYDFLHGSD